MFKPQFRNLESAATVMKIRLIVPDVNVCPTDRPRECRHCGGVILQRHQSVIKPIKDHKLEQVEAVRYKCADCKRTFRHYPDGVTAKDQSQRTVVLAAVMYGLGLSCSAVSHLLGALGAPIGKMTAWRDVQEAGEALSKKRPAGNVRVLGADETVYKVKGEEVVVGFVTDAQSGRFLGLEILVEGDGQAFKEWLEPYVTEYGAQVLVSDDNASYGVAARGLGLEHQICITHVSKYVARRAKSILKQAQQEYGEDDEQLSKLKEDLEQVKALVEELSEQGGIELGRLHQQYLWTEPPKQDEQALAGYRMRMLTLELWEKWQKLRLYLRRPELGLDGTNNCSERTIGKSKLRYKTMRGYKSLQGMGNGIRLTQWLYSGDESHDLAEAMAA